ncbi:MAG: ankyrin repeat domain-containing protein [Blastochloris sp.]|nr:ankyrin repeat domain-containing protein [Blastochloris sp.]
MTPLASAAFKGDVITLRHLVAEGYEIDEADENGYSALTYASHSGQTDAARVLLEAGADPTVRQSNDTFHTPLTIAAFRGHFAIVKLLVAYGADVDMYAGIWQVPAECYARRQGYHHISEYLEYHKKAKPKPGH